MPSKTYDAKVDKANSLRALERDAYCCVWCKHILGITSQGSVPHHIFGRRRNFSTDAQVTLCMTRSRADAKGNTIGCHTRYETAYVGVDGKVEVTKDALISLMKRVYGVELQGFY